MSAEASKKKPFYNQVWFWIVIVIAVLAIGGGVASSNNEPKKVGGNDGESSGQVEDGNFKVGDVISVDGQEVTILSVKRDYQTGNDYFTAKDGKEYVKVDVQIQNKSQETKDYNMLYWEIEDGSGDINSYMDAAFAQADDNLGSGNLAAGGTKKGSIVFEVPKGDAALKLHYKPNLFSSKEVVIEL